MTSRPKKPVDFARPQPEQPWLLLSVLTTVFAAIGTSPLYAFRITLATREHWTSAELTGLVSLIVWLLLLVGLKYVVVMLRADNRGEGGTLALLGLALRSGRASGHRWLVFLGLAGLGLLYGDTVLMPVVTVLSALEGVPIYSPETQTSVTTLAVVALAALFLAQARGVSLAGRVFLPVMGVWFVVLAIKGAWAIAQHPQVLLALNPVWAWRFVSQLPFGALTLLSALVLVVVGAEALYAEMGPYGRRRLRQVWFLLVFPALLLSYLGQGASVLVSPDVASNPFFLMVPAWAGLPLTLLALLAALTASQTILSTVFSATRQAVQLGYLPPMALFHVADTPRGSTYMPRVNGLLFALMLAVLFGFHDVEGLARAYGFAHAGAMLMTTLLAFWVVPAMAENGRRIAWFVVLFAFLCLDGLLFSAGALKLAFGAWAPLTLGVLLCGFMFTWTLGRDLLRASALRDQHPLAEFMQTLEQYPPVRVAGTAVFMNTHAGTVPPALLHNLKHNKVLHEQVVFLTVKVEDVPYVAQQESFSLTPLSESSWELVGRWGFKQETHVPRLLGRVAMLHPELDLEPMRLSYYLSRQSLIVLPRRPWWKLWWRRLFSFMNRNAGQPTRDFRLPPNAVVEMGMQREI